MREIIRTILFSQSYEEFAVMDGTLGGQLEFYLELRDDLFDIIDSEF